MNEKSDNGSAESPFASPPKPPRPPPPNLSKQSSIAQHLQLLQSLRSERVRWFVKEDNKKWSPLNGKDSLAIEACYQRIQDLEQASGNEDPSKPLNTQIIYDLPVVKGGLYEVDVVARECSPIYWKESSKPVCRGTWFLGGSSSDAWQPISEDDAEQIEFSHQGIWRAMGLGIAADSAESMGADKEAMGRLQLKGYHVEWKDVTDVWLYWDDIKSRIIRGVGTKIGLGSQGVQIHRGYHTDAVPEDCPPEISHLVFVIHGIGQLLHMSNIVKSATDFRSSAEKVHEKNIPGFPRGQRVEFFPVEWRSSLKLDDGAIDAITPASVSGLRKVLNITMMDIMYYTSPFYRYEIISGLREELNRLYSLFCERNPSFQAKQGKVSIIAHSLGSVIMYDILSLWDTEIRHLSDQEKAGTGFLTESFSFLRNVTGYPESESSDSDPEGSPLRQARKENIRVELSKARSKVMELEAKLKSQIEFDQNRRGENGSTAEDVCQYALKFKVENLFSVGSPLAVFLTLRGLRPQDDVEDHVLPKSVCKKMLNIYHPADPVAYRMEPLISEEYSSVPPIQLHRFDSHKLGYLEEKKPARESGGWKFFNYKVGYSKSSEEPRSRSGSTASDSDAPEDEIVIVGHSVPQGGREDQCDGDRGKAKEKKSGWISSWFGSSQRKSVESDGQCSEDGATSNGQANRRQKAGAGAPEYIAVPSKDLSDRLDYVLREGYMESNYWSAVTSHVSYWTSSDVARFVLENTLEFVPSPT
ncbi:phospholipase DDHD1 [Nematostella vectensis]|uniref:phospholipase DDHD1 n=1 Tax=Nematostella vectensis TaxID=45351 RepID=UPI0020773399|nr:phospholipase DDHD1 [Nematostella vectensis]XP_048577942.1 phospholipase DDHD1 [Nematostella vectensis]